MLELECGEERDICQAPDSVSTWFSSQSSRWRQQQVKCSSVRAKLLLVFLQMKFSRICKEVLRSCDPKRSRARSQDPHGTQEWQGWAVMRGWGRSSQGEIAVESPSSEQGKKPLGIIIIYMQNIQILAIYRDTTLLQRHDNAESDFAWMQMFLSASYIQKI